MERRPRVKRKLSLIGDTPDKALRSIERRIRQRAEERVFDKQGFLELITRAEDHFELTPSKSPRLAAWIRRLRAQAKEAEETSNQVARDARALNAADDVLGRVIECYTIINVDEFRARRQKLLRFSNIFEAKVYFKDAQNPTHLELIERIKEIQRRWALVEEKNSVLD